MLSPGCLLLCDIYHVGIPEILYISCAVNQWKKIWQTIYLESVCPPTCQMSTDIKANSAHASCWQKENHYSNC